MFKWALLGALLAVVLYFSTRTASELPVHTGGTVDARFQRVKEVFDENFKEGLESAGASFAVYVKGKKVIDLWGGYSDKEALRKWKEDTISIVFSSSKGVGSLCISMLVDRGLLSYDDLVVKHWPEFGHQGKANVTVQMLVSHQAGLVCFDDEVSYDEAANHKAMSKRIEEQKPNWPPGSKSMYHPINHGWLVDQLIRRVDSKKRGVGQFVREEFRQPHNIDIHLGLPTAETGRVARLFKASASEGLHELFSDSNAVKAFGAMCWQMMTKGNFILDAMKNVPWMDFFHRLLVNNPDVWKLEQSGALGIGNARALATLYDLVVRKQVVSEKMLVQLQKPYAKLDVGVEVAKLQVGNGFMFLPYERANAKYLIGHAGFGCQQGSMDVHNEIAIGYTTTGIRPMNGHQCTAWMRLLSALYDVFEGKK